MTLVRILLLMDRAKLAVSILCAELSQQAVGLYCPTYLFYRLNKQDIA